MNYQVLLSYMKKFSVNSLKAYLGDDIYDSLIEWKVDNKPLESKKRLAEMIIAINGISILKNKEFRKDLLHSFSVDDICQIANVDVIQKTDDIELVIENIVKNPWKDSTINNRLLKYLELTSEEVFFKDTTEEVVSETVESYDKFYELLDYQYVIRQRALNILNSNNNLERFLIHMPTGTGKTKTATHIICQYYNYIIQNEGLIIWIAHTKELLQQAYDTFKNVWKNIGNGSITMYKLWGDNTSDLTDETSGFMVAGIKKLLLMMSKSPDQFDILRKRVRLIIYDEAHKATATETKKVIDRLMDRKGGLEDRSLMGLTATPGRTSDYSLDNNLLAIMFGNRIIEIDTKLMNMINMSAQEAANTRIEKDVISYFQNRGVLAKIDKQELIYQDSFTDEELNQIKVEMSNNGYEDFSKKSLEIIGANKNRNKEIIKKLKYLNSEKIPTIVFACSVRHGQLLSSVLELDNIPNALVIGSMSNYEREEAIKQFKSKESDINILINYEVLTTGFDATNIECVFIARPTQSIVLYSQMLGRGLRGPQMGGKERCLLIDVKDNLKKFDEKMAFSHFNNYWNV